MNENQALLARATAVPDDCVDLVDAEASRVLGLHVASLEAVEQKAARYLVLFGGSSGAVVVLLTTSRSLGMFATIVGVLALALVAGSAVAAAIALRVGRLPVTARTTVLPEADQLTSPYKYKRLLILSRMQDSAAIGLATLTRARWQRNAEYAFLVGLGMLVVFVITTKLEGYNGQSERQAGATAHTESDRAEAEGGASPDAGSARRLEKGRLRQGHHKVGRARR